MKEYRKILDFEYCNVPYTMFIDKKDRYFFMRRNSNGDYYYTTYDEQKKLFEAFVNICPAMNIMAGDKVKIAPKVLMGVLVTSLSLSMLAGCAKGSEFKAIGSDGNLSYSYSIENNYNDKIDMSFTDSLIDEDFEIDTIDVVPGGGNRTRIYDSAYLSEALGDYQPTLNDFYKVIDSNNNITDQYKDLIREFVTAYITKTPDADRRILYHNLQTLQIRECDDAHLLLTTFNEDAVACYIFKENTICVLSDYKFEKGTWAYQTIFHELTHVARNAYFNKGGKNYEIKSGGYNYSVLMLDETLNTIYAIDLLDYFDQDFAYQLQSNYMDIILDSMDNYKNSDYINHSQGYFIAKLDEYMGTQGYAGVMIELLQAQFNDFHDDNIKAEQSEYYPLYDFVSDVFYKDRLHSGMSYDEALAVKDELVSRIMFDVPEEYEIDVNHFDEHFNEYCANLGIEVVNKSL